MKDQLHIEIRATTFPSKATPDILHWSAHIKGVAKSAFQALPRDLKWVLSLYATRIEDRLNARFPQTSPRPASPDDRGPA